MRVNAEKVIVTVIVLSFVLTSMNVLSAATGPITREEAVEISRNTPVVQQAMSEAVDALIVTADYWSADYINSVRQEGPGDVMEKLPSDHGAWRIGWNNAAPGYHILHFIDELTGQILYEMRFVA